ncbi:MAG: YcaO-like family protein [Planctomycetes bacterium]|nr:YcaO-like family protein [Planctomycetota bacterium]MBL7042820.1 YcaO-like family protein [Pirellulaceae bacterium]
MNVVTVQRCRQMFDALVGRRTGIVRDVRLVATVDGDADLHHAAAATANAHPGTPTDMKRAVGGAGTTREAAVMASLGEALERYLASSYRRGHAPVRSEAELDCEAIPAAAFAQFSPRQRRQEGLPFEQATQQTPLRWVNGKRLSGDSPCAVPAFAVYLPYVPEPGEAPIAPGISTGLACGDSQESALLGAACEVIERDALALTWMTGITPPRIEQEAFVDLAGDLLPPRDECRAFDLTNDVGVPVVLVVCRGQGPSGRLLSVGSASRPDRDAAIRKAAMEASQDRVYVRHLVGRDPDWRPRPDYSNVTDFSYHARLYSVRPDLVGGAFAFLDDMATDRILIPTLFRGESGPMAEALNRVIRRLLDSGHDGVWVDLTPEWAKSQRLHVVKLVVPSLLPLHGDHRLPYLGHPRLADSHRAMPHGSKNHEYSLWPYPHPFP